MFKTIGLKNQVRKTHTYNTTQYSSQSKLRRQILEQWALYGQPSSSPLPPPNQPSVCDVVVNTYQLKISKSSPRKNILTCKIKSLKIDQVLFKKRKKSKQNMAIIKKRYTLKYKNSVLNHAATLHICTITTRRRKENLQTRKQWAAS